MKHRRNTDFIPQCVVGGLFLFVLQPVFSHLGGSAVCPSSFFPAEQKDGMCFVPYVSYMYRSHFSIYPLLM